jgi:hypothetical protein
MPIKKVGVKWRYGNAGKLYRRKADAFKQARAIWANKRKAITNASKTQP